MPVSGCRCGCACVFVWAFRRGHCSGWGEVSTRTMEGTRFGDLVLRLGAHYLFRHHGDCEHLMVFTDMW